MSPLTQGPLETDYQKLHRLTPLKRGEHIFMLTLGTGRKRARWSLISHSTQHMSATTGDSQRRRKSTPRVDRICITAFSNPR